MHEKILDIYYHEIKTLEQSLHYFQKYIEGKITSDIDFSVEINHSMNIFLRMLKIKTQIAIDREQTNLVDYYHREEQLSKLRRKLKDFCGTMRKQNLLIDISPPSEK